MTQVTASIQVKSNVTVRSRNETVWLTDDSNIWHLFLTYPLAVEIVQALVEHYPEIAKTVQPS